jgi:hypothetical protein
MGLGSSCHRVVASWRSLNFEISTQLAYLVISIRDIICWPRRLFIRFVLHSPGQIIVQTSASWHAMAVVSVCVARYQFIHCIRVCHGCSGPIEDSNFHQYGHGTSICLGMALHQLLCQLVEGQIFCVVLHVSRALRILVIMFVVSRSVEMVFDSVIINGLHYWHDALSHYLLLLLA